MEGSIRTRRRPASDAPDAAHRIFASASDALFLIDREGRVTAWSPGAERLFGRSSADQLGRPAAEIAGGPWADRLPALIAAVLGGDPGRQEEMTGLRGDTTEVHVDLSLSAVRDGDGSATGIVGVAREIGERRRIEEALRSREGRLLEVARMTTAGEILAGLAHEVNQPLTSISNFAGACQHLMKTLDHPEAERLHSHLHQIIEQATKAAEIVRRARRFVRRSSEPVFFDLEDLARESVALLRFEESRSQVSVRVEADAPVTVMGDRPLIEQVIVNLLRNAYESFAPDSRDRRVRVRIAADGAEAFVSVEDNGVGIGEEAAGQPCTFRSTKAHGLGLGLCICRTILERHHGRLLVEQAPGGGTIARFTLPLHQRRGGHV